MSYRPICDVWILARAKLKRGAKYYGAYPGGFLWRARALLGVSLDDPVLHVCGGLARPHPHRGFGPWDETLDLDPATNPDWLQDACDPYPTHTNRWPAKDGAKRRFKAVLADPPYTEGDAEKYAPGSLRLPSANIILRNALDMLGPGGRVGILHYASPSPPKGAIFVAFVAVWVGFNNRVRAYTIFEKGQPDG